MRASKLGGLRLADTPWAVGARLTNPFHSCFLEFRPDLTLCAYASPPPSSSNATASGGAGGAAEVGAGAAPRERRAGQALWCSHLLLPALSAIDTLEAGEPVYAILNASAGCVQTRAGREPSRELKSTARVCSGALPVSLRVMGASCGLFVWCRPSAEPGKKSKKAGSLFKESLAGLLRESDVSSDAGQGESVRD